jgi:hypothetical protein
VDGEGAAMSTATIERTRYATVETAMPLTDEELWQKQACGWKYLRTVKRVSKSGAPYLVYEFERNERAGA